jgi:hypothetical protein
MRKIESTRGSHHRFTETIRHSPRNGFTAYIALSPVIGLFVTVAGGTLPANLTPASRRQNHTTSSSASEPFVSGTSASIASRSAFVTIASAPPSERDGAHVSLICFGSEVEYFFRCDWTASISLIWLIKFADARERFSLLGVVHTVIARLDRATQYAVASRLISLPLEYWIVRFRGR